jgi:hypothetical protein
METRPTKKARLTLSAMLPDEAWAWVVRFLDSSECKIILPMLTPTARAIFATWMRTEASIPMWWFETDIGASLHDDKRYTITFDGMLAGIQALPYYEKAAVLFSAPSSLDAKRRIADNRSQHRLITDVASKGHDLQLLACLLCHNSSYGVHFSRCRYPVPSGRSYSLMLVMMNRLFVDSVKSWRRVP